MAGGESVADGDFFGLAGSTPGSASAVGSPVVTGPGSSARTASRTRR
ncbi:hypothetical protein [Haladaptatus sp. W1]|nr:hypothetical protein [Haladaptatus sp. W1]